MVGWHGQRSLMGYSPWGHKASDMTERLSTVERSGVMVCREPSGITPYRPLAWEGVRAPGQHEIWAGVREGKLPLLS